jgi:hypothetical protein
MFIILSILKASDEEIRLVGRWFERKKAGYAKAVDNAQNRSIISGGKWRILGGDCHCAPREEREECR